VIREKREFFALKPMAMAETCGAYWRMHGKFGGHHLHSIYKGHDVTDKIERAVNQDLRSGIMRKWRTIDRKTH
jgi:Spy/CpxP family protein refolding chaperone